MAFKMTGMNFGTGTGSAMNKNSAYKKTSAYKQADEDDAPKKTPTDEARIDKINKAQADEAKKVKDATGLEFSKSYLKGEYDESNEEDRLHDVMVANKYDSRPPNKETGDKGGHYYHMVRDPKMLKSKNVSLENYRGPAVPGVTPDDYVEGSDKSIKFSK